MSILKYHCCLRQRRIALFLLRFGLLFSARQPQQREQDESHTGADCASVVRPGRAQEPWILVVPWLHNWNSGRTLKSRPSTSSQSVVRTDADPQERSTHPFRLWSITNLKTPCLSGARKVTEYCPGVSGTGGREIRTWGSSMVNSNWRSEIPEYGVHDDVAGSYLEM